jgi:hypothetical protein
MSIVICEGCDFPIDSDDDPDCFIDVSKTKTVAYCEYCRELHYDLTDTRDEGDAQ